MQEKPVTNEYGKIIERGCDGDFGADVDVDGMVMVMRIMDGTHAAALGSVRLSTGLDFAILIVL